MMTRQHRRRKFELALGLAGCLAGALGVGGCGGVAGGSRPGIADADARAMRAGDVGPARGTADAGVALSEGLEGLSQVTFAGEGAALDPAIAPDGAFMVFASTQLSPRADLFLKRSGGNTITQITADPADDIMPAISPDGSRVAFASDRGGSWDLYLVPSTGGAATQLTRGMGQALYPSWSPDGERLAFCRLGATSGRWELWVLEVSNPDAAEFVGYGQQPKWSPVARADGSGTQTILFQRGRERGDRAFGVWTIEYAPGRSSAPTQIVSAGDGAAINPSWSPDGRFIVYARADGGQVAADGSPAMSDLWMTDLSGSLRVKLTDGRFQNLMPTWGGDGRIYFVSDRGGAAEPGSARNIWSIGTSRALAAADRSGTPVPAGAPARASAMVESE